MTTSRQDRQREPGPVSAENRPLSLADHLQWVHDMLRRDLAAVQLLATAVSAGASTEDVHSQLRDLQSSGPLFQLRVNCLTFCQTLHSHHRNEDVSLFPAVRRTAPHLSSTIDRLETDHRVVARLLEEVEAHAQGLESQSVREALVAALTALSTHLLHHLELEEATLQPILDDWTERPEHLPKELSDAISARAAH